FLGTLAPGNSPAEVSFQGDVTLGTSSTLDIELAGLTNGSFDRLDVSGDAAIAGSLVVTAIDGFQPLPGDSFEIIAADAVAGTFDAVTNAFGLVGLGLDVDYLTDAVMLEPTRLLDGDANFDGVVDLADFGLLRSGFGSAGRNAADFNLDGTVDLADFGILRAFFGQSLGGDLGAGAGDLAMMDAWAATVPEPSSVALLVPAGLTLLRRRRS
ncbi:MAG: dockerin type I domain-containing protein, partial [Planctomycetota bacterium]